MNYFSVFFGNCIACRRWSNSLRKCLLLREMWWEQKNRNGLVATVPPWSTRLRLDGFATTDCIWMSLSSLVLCWNQFFVFMRIKGFVLFKFRERCLNSRYMWILGIGRLFFILMQYPIKCWRGMSPTPNHSVLSLPSFLLKTIIRENQLRLFSSVLFPKSWKWLFFSEREPLESWFFFPVFLSTLLKWS